MARIWMEPYKGHEVPYEYQADLDRAPLLPKQVMMVSVASCTFQFVPLRQLRDCLAYYEKNSHASSSLDIGAADHWEAQCWFERLPMHLLESPKRAKVVKALKRAVTLAETEAFSQR